MVYRFRPRIQPAERPTDCANRTPEKGGRTTSTRMTSRATVVLQSLPPVRSGSGSILNRLRSEVERAGEAVREELSTPPQNDQKADRIEYLARVAALAQELVTRCNRERLDLGRTIQSDEGRM